MADRISASHVMRAKTMELYGWGRYPRARARVVRPERVTEVDPAGEEHALARGLGRSYGDAAISSEGVVVLTERLNRFLAFEERAGVLRAEAGATIAEILRTFLPRGWFPAVTPGTKHVTLGGCVAADAHGKNHHRAGSFGAHIAELEVVLADGRRVRCSREHEADLFRATVGGMGLTGIITEVTCALRPVETARMIVRHHPARDLEDSLRLLADADCDDDYTVSWVDCQARGARLGRGVLISGHHAQQAELPPGYAHERARQPKRRSFDVPFDFPSWALNRPVARALNRLYFHCQSRRRAPFVAGTDSFFYPLDAVGKWNRAYGARGFVQYQCVLPMAESLRGLREMLEALALSRLPCFLAVLKRFGAEGEGLLSFPMPGYTLALDLPVRGGQVFDLAQRFDEIVLRSGGRVYLAKDACLDAASFRAMYPRYQEWRELKARFDPGERFRSDLSHRLGITS